MICIAGKNDIATNVLEYLLRTEKKENIKIICNKTDKGVNTFQKSLRLFAREKGIQEITLEEIYKIKDVLFLSLEFDRIVDPLKFQSNRLFNIHFSLLPAYKGMYTSALPILLGESRTGVTFHEIDHGIDTGAIIAQTEIPISPIETAKSLYLKYIENGTSLVIDNLESVLSDNYLAQPQSPLGSTYFSKSAIDYSIIKIDLNSTAGQIGRQLRAFTFRDYQMPTVFGFKISKHEIMGQRSVEAPGKVVFENEIHIEVATVDYNIKLFKDYFENLCKACEIDDIYSIKKLLPFVDLNERTKEGWTPLIIAAYNNSLKAMRLVIDCGAEPNFGNYNHTTPLMYAKACAIRTNDYSSLELLLNRGADYTAKDVFNQTVLDYAAIEDPKVFNFIKRFIND